MNQPDESYKSYGSKVFDKAKIMEFIPKLNKDSEEDLNDFKDKILQLILEYEIFVEESFIDFFQAVCEVNNHVTETEIEDIFNEIKSLLYDQFQDEIENMEDEKENMSF